MPTGHLLLNAEGTVDSNSPHHRHRRCGFAVVWLSNLENIQLGYRSPRKSPSPFLQRFQNKEMLMSPGRDCGVKKVWAYVASAEDLGLVTKGGQQGTVGSDAGFLAWARYLDL